jgi:hypothetical protein
LDADTLQMLLNIAPTPEEVELVKGFAAEGDRRLLANAEQFFLALAPIPRIQQRLKLALFRLQFDPLAAGLEEALAVVEAALRELKGSKGLLTVLEVILALGNYMNAEGAKGGVSLYSSCLRSRARTLCSPAPAQAYGFRLSALGRLGATKSADGSISLLQYVVTFVRRRHPAAASFAQEIRSVQSAARVEAAFVAAETRKIGGMVKQLEAELKTHVATP